MIRFVSLFVLLFSSHAYAGGMDHMINMVDNVSSKLLILGIAICSSAFVLDYFFKIDFLSHLIMEYKRKLFYATIFVLVFSVFEDPIKDQFSKIQNPSNLLIER